MKKKMIFSMLVLSTAFLSACNAVETKKTYTVVWKNADGTILETDENVVAGKFPSYDGRTPLKDNSGNWEFSKWDKELVYVYADVEYTAVYKAVPKYSRDGNEIMFGSYPQSVVNDEATINNLNTKAGELPTENNLNGWVDYNYYVYGNINSFMFYKDIDVNSDGTNDYRGVYYTQYRPYWFQNPSDNPDPNGSPNSYQLTNGYDKNIIHWFKYDSIIWDVLKEQDGKALIITSSLMDSQCFYPSHSGSLFEHNGKVGYANDYELSSIREYINDDFYNAAFKNNEKEIIKITHVDNSPASTSHNPNDACCDDTDDKMFILSYQEVLEFYPTDDARLASGTDYAKCQGLMERDGYSYWWLRSPIYNYYKWHSNYVDYNGQIDGNFYSAGACEGGVRVACWINL